MTEASKSEYEAHIENCRLSGLSIKAYSKRHSLKYDTFLYHYRKRYPKNNQERLIPVQVNSADDCKELGCRIELRTGHVLWLRDKASLLSILPALL